MRVVIVCPFAVGSRLGNRITAVRWRMLLTELGHRVRVTTGLPRERYDALVALHAFKTTAAVRWSRETHPDRPVVVALTGTDLYRDIRIHEEARRSLRLADRLVVLHDHAPRELPHWLRGKARIIRQSAEPMHAAVVRSRGTFDVAFIAHLRPEKDPLRAALAARLVPSASRLRIVHAGRGYSGARKRILRSSPGSPGKCALAGRCSGRPPKSEHGAPSSRS